MLYIYCSESFEPDFSVFCRVQFANVAIWVCVASLYEAFSHKLVEGTWNQTSVLFRVKLVCKLNGIRYTSCSGSSFFFLRFLLAKMIALETQDHG